MLINLGMELKVVLVLLYFCPPVLTLEGSFTSSWLQDNRGNGHLHYLQLPELAELLEKSCVLLCVPPCDSFLQPVLLQLSLIFKYDDSVLISQFFEANTSSEIKWKAGFEHNTHEDTRIAFYARERKDRTCLLSPSRRKFQAEPYVGPLVLDTLVQFVNEKCGVFRSVGGSLTATGLFHEHLMQNLYHSNSITSIGECRRIKMPSKFEFFQEYLSHSRPVVIENAVSNWPAMKKWTMEYFHELYGNRQIHIKLTADGIFEGVESASLWSGYREGRIPEEVKVQLEFPDLVVVRPATSEMLFLDFLNFVTSSNKSYSAYLEYSSIPHYMPKLEEDVMDLPFVDGVLERQHLNMWLSDGNTLGKLHFDPYDNLLCQVSGEKHVTLFDPHHNENLYEAHIPEALLTFDPKSGTFHRKTPLESTSMVMSPVDIENPDLERFPNFAQAKSLHCVLRRGDVLFMPAFWWHEVQSYPDLVEKRNLAVNFWYEPLLKKEFPCAECRLYFNIFYRHLLYDPPS